MGNRFDVTTSQIGVLYFGTELTTCYAEVLARFRPDPEITQRIRADWEQREFMGGRCYAI